MSSEIPSLENERNENFHRRIETGNEDLKDCAVYELGEEAEFSPEQTEKIKDLSYRSDTKALGTIYDSKFLIFSFLRTANTLNVSFGNAETNNYRDMWNNLRDAFGDNLILRGVGRHYIQGEEHITEDQFNAYRNRISYMSWGELDKDSQLKRIIK